MKKYSMQLRVQYYETDAMGIVHHSNYIRYFETARTEFMRVSGYPYEKMEAKGLMIPVLGVNAEYKSPAVYDEMLTIECWIKKIGGASFEVEYEVKNSENGMLHVKGWSRHGFTDKELKPLPLKKKFPDIYKVFTEYLS